MVSAVGVGGVTVTQNGVLEFTAGQVGIGIRHMVLEPMVGKENRGDCLHKVRD